MIFVPDIPILGTLSSFALTIPKHDSQLPINSSFSLFQNKLYNPFQAVANGKTAPTDFKIYKGLIFFALNSDNHIFYTLSNWTKRIFQKTR